MIRAISIRQVLAYRLTQEDKKYIVIWKWKNMGNTIIIVERLPPTMKNYKKVLQNLKEGHFIYPPKRLRPNCIL
jgi:hypothetical protein